jgi:transposase
MFEQTVSVALTCPTHPAFTPAEEAPTKKCRCCQAISNVYEWLRMADRTATKINDQFYTGSDPEVSAPKIEEIAAVAGEPVDQVSEGTGKKRAISTMVEKAPEKLDGTGRRVRRKF